jgi:hypothetical protein
VASALGEGKKELSGDLISAAKNSKASTFIKQKKKKSCQVGDFGFVYCLSSRFFFIQKFEQNIWPSFIFFCLFSLRFLFIFF